MGWRDRDWAKFTPEEFDAIYGGGSAGPLRPSGAGRAGASSSGRSAARIAIASLVGFALLFGGTLAVGHFRSPSVGGAAPSLRLSPVAPVVNIPAPRPDPKLIRIHWRTTDLAPSPYAGRICVTDGRHGNICASYVIGERPADTLTRRLETLGLRVESSG